MPTRRTIIRAAIAALLAVLPVAGYANAPLVFLGDRSLPPYEFLEAGKPRGANVELARAIGRVLQRPVEVRLLDWADAQARLLAGEGDALTFLARTAQRDRSFLFSQSTFPVVFALFVRADDAQNFSDPELLARRRVGVTRGGLARQHLQANHPDAELVLLDDDADGIRKLLRGEVDAVAGNAWTMRHYLYGAGVSGVAELPGLLRRTGNIAVRADDAALLAQIDHALDALKTSGEFDAIIDRWSHVRVHLVPEWLMRAALAAGLAAALGLGVLAVLALRLRAGKKALAHEMAERSRAREALSESEARFRGTFEQAAVGMAHAAPDGSWIRVNSRFCSMLGYREAELLGRSFRDVTHPDDLAADVENIRRLRAGEIQTYTMRKRYMRKDGSTFCGELTVSLLRDEVSGKLLHSVAVIQDITERVAAEAALAESEARMRTIVETVPVGLLLAEMPSGRIVGANSYIATMLRHPVHYSPNVDSYDAWVAFHADGTRVKSHEYPLARIALADEENPSVEVHYQRGDGTRVWTRIMGRAVRNDCGEVVGGVVAVVDVDRERRAVEALAESEERFRSFAEHAPDVIYIIDAATRRLEYLSPAYERVWGEPRAIVMQNPDRWEELLHPDDKDQAIAQERRYYESDGPIHFDYRIRRASDGAERHIRDTAVPICDAQGRVIRIIGTAHDVTERRLAEAALQASEERLSLASAAAELGVWDMDISSGVALVNAQYRALYGLPPLDGPLSRAEWIARIHPDDLDGVLAKAGETIPAGGEFRHEFRIIRADTGEERWVTTRGRAVGSGPVPTRAVGVSYDITERRLAEERQLLLAREVDHRAKNVLAVVQAIVKLTRAEDPRHFADAVEGRVAALARAHTLLSRDRWTGADLLDTVREELTAYRGEGRVVLEGPSVRLKPDAVQPLSMVLHELATNAAKYGALSVPEGRVTVSWRLEGDESATASGGTRLYLSWVERGGPELSAPPKRRGFGSAVVEASVRGQLRGTVAAEWAREGLRYHLSLPAALVLAALPEAHAETTFADCGEDTAAAAEPPTAILQGRRVLVVEDEPLVALETEAALVELGCEVVGPASTLDDAMRLASAQARYLDIAVLDVNLNGLVSFPVAELLGAHGVPVIYVTGYGSVPPSHSAAHVAALLPKPLRPGDLAAALRLALKARSAARAPSPVG